MSDLEAPEIPIELSGKLQEPAKEKKGFFARLFSKENAEPQEVPALNDTIMHDAIPMPDLETSDLSVELPRINDNVSSASMPVFNDQINERMNAGSSGKAKGKHKDKAAKGHKSKSKKYDESSQFDWTRDIHEQEILIHDNNRFNPDINMDTNSLMKKADDYANDGMLKLGKNEFVSGHSNVDISLDPIDIDINKLGPLPSLDVSSIGNPSMPSVDSQTGELFSKVANSHGKIRKKLHKVVHSKDRPKKEELKQLLSEYDESIEKHIENKEMEIASKKQHLDKLEKHLKTKEKVINDTHAKVVDLHKQLQEKHDDINDVVADTVERELSRRIKQEKDHLKNELKTTVKLNLELRKKIKLADDQKAKQDKEYQKMIDTEQKKLNELQSVYEKKLSQLTAEKNKLEKDKADLESRRSDAMKLIRKAQDASKELDHINQIKNYVDTQKQHVEHEIVEDKELKRAIDAAEKSLTEEKKNLDNLIFSRYIENKLKSIKPENLNDRQDWKTELGSNPLYAQINDCKKMLAQKDINGAKNMYNKIRVAYEQTHTSRKEKEALYVAIRELYNEIQLKIVETQMRPR